MLIKRRLNSVLKKLLDYATGNINDESDEPTITNLDIDLDSNTKEEIKLTDNEQEKLSTEDEKKPCPCEKCKLLKLESIYAKITDSKEITISGHLP